ncbi:hypothetical protein BD770DRAFT_330854 [Pilaira anomala]|nr:hypothetical protein BD770DRAFT_330854 [Pilaira anomala]
MRGGDPTVKLVYAIAKKALDYQIWEDEKKEDVLIDVCDNTNNQFKRIMEAM